MPFIIMLHEISNKFCSFYSSWKKNHKNIKQQKLVSALVIIQTIINNLAPVVIQHIKMIYADHVPLK